MFLHSECFDNSVQQNPESQSNEYRICSVRVTVPQSSTSCHSPHFTCRWGTSISIDSLTTLPGVKNHLRVHDNDLWSDFSARSADEHQVLTIEVATFCRLLAVRTDLIKAYGAAAPSCCTVTNNCPYSTGSHRALLPWVFSLWTDFEAACQEHHHPNTGGNTKVWDLGGETETFAQETANIRTSREVGIQKGQVTESRSPQLQ